MTAYFLMEHWRGILSEVQNKGVKQISPSDAGLQAS